MVKDKEVLKGDREDKRVKYALSDGYIVVDPKKCAGCIACMLVCSMVHEGKTSPSFARIQVIQSAFKPFPNDISLNICRQCVNPLCVKACRIGALHVDNANGNVRIVDETLCDGCMDCIHACPYKPSRMVWNHEKGIAIKCDLCLDTPYWNQAGGANGRQACVEICPTRAIKLVKQVPEQKGDAGYNVNLRNEHWRWLGFPID